jgi:hypothetical protein
MRLDAVESVFPECSVTVVETSKKHQLLSQLYISMLTFKFIVKSFPVRQNFMLVNQEFSFRLDLQVATAPSLFG